MTRHFITLGDGRKIGIARYVAAWRECLRLVNDGAGDTHIGKGVTGWGQTAAEALWSLRRGLDDRMNRGDPRKTWRKWDGDWQRDMGHAARRLNTPRLAIHWLPAELRQRFADHISTDD